MFAESEDESGWIDLLGDVRRLIYYYYNAGCFLIRLRCGKVDQSARFKNQIKKQELSSFQCQFVNKAVLVPDEKVLGGRAENEGPAVLREAGEDVEMVASGSGKKRKALIVDENCQVGVPRNKDNAPYHTLFLELQ